jgi:GNAT superfamily N-acetyltransferase
MPDITCSGQYAHYFGRVEQDRQKDVAGFCYAYCNVDSIHVEVAGIYVDENLRHRGIGTKLLTEAVKASYSSMGSRSFALRFISEAPRESSMAENIRRQFPEAFPGAVFTPYYPEDPRHERTGAGQLDQN